VLKAASAKRTTRKGVTGGGKWAWAVGRGRRGASTAQEQQKQQL